MMSHLSWDRPAKIMTVQQWQAISADSAPPGVYVPNMSDADAKRWKAKLVGVRSEEFQIELRKSLGGCQIVLIVARDGYNYKYYKRDPDRWGASTRGKNMHLALNGPAQMTYAEWDEMVAVVAEARQVLSRLELGDKLSDILTGAA